MQVLQVVFGDRISRATVCVLSLTIARVAGVIVGEGEGGKMREEGGGLVPSPQFPLSSLAFSLSPSLSRVS